MIDDREQVERLVAKMRASLPLAATASPELRNLMRQKSPEIDGAQQWQVTRIEYAGDEGGIICAFEFGQGEHRQGYVVSMTHLHFAAGRPLTREIAAYQKRRIKRLRRLQEA